MEQSKQYIKKTTGERVEKKRAVTEETQNNEVTGKDDDETRSNKLIDNSNKREHFQREMAQDFLKKLDPDDFIIINDIDEIPNLESINLKDVKQKLVLFKQKMFYFKFNLLYENLRLFYVF